MAVSRVMTRADAELELNRKVSSQACSSMGQLLCKYSALTRAVPRKAGVVSSRMEEMSDGLCRR